MKSVNAPFPVNNVLVFVLHLHFTFTSHTTCCSKYCQKQPYLFCEPQCIYKKCKQIYRNLTRMQQTYVYNVHAFLYTCMHAACLWSGGCFISQSVGGAKRAPARQSATIGRWLAGVIKKLLQACRPGQSLAPLYRLQHTKTTSARLRVALTGCIGSQYATRGLKNEMPSPRLYV